MIKLAAYAALAMAGALLGLQILGAIEYTEGGSLYARASVIAAMVTLAALPVFIEAARHVKAWGLVFAFGVAFVALLAYSLPATVGKTGEVKVSKLADAAAVARTRDDLERVTKTLNWARADMIEDCGGGEGKKCRAKRNTVQALEDRSEKLKGELAVGEKAAPGDLGAEAWAWASNGQLTAEQVRKGSVIAFALGLDVCIWALVWFATFALTSGSVASFSGSPARLPTFSEPANDLHPVIEALQRAGGSVESNRQLAQLMQVTDGESSKRVAEVADRLAIVRDGKQTRIALRAA